MQIQQGMNMSKLGGSVLQAGDWLSTISVASGSYFHILKTVSFQSFSFPAVLWNSKNSQDYSFPCTGYQQAWQFLQLLQLLFFFLLFLSCKSDNSLKSLFYCYALSSTLISLASQTVMAKQIYFIIQFIPLLLHNYSPGSTSGFHPRSFSAQL